MTGTLTLNASYEPLNVVPMHRLNHLLMRDVADVLETDDTRMIRTRQGLVPYPTVVRLKKMVKVPHKHRSRVTNTFLFARDRYTCQYCGKTDKTMGGRESMTRDHIIPKCQGGKDVWTNVTTACGRCNSRKDNKTPEQAGMKLRSKPTVPSIVQLKWKIRKLTKMQAKYIRQFYGDDWGLYVDSE